MSRTWLPWQAVMLVVVVTGLVVAGLAAVGTSAPDRQQSTIQSGAERPATNAGVAFRPTNPSSYTSDAAWTQARANAANTNYINTTGPTNPITVRWRFETEADSYSGGPLVANGTVYFVTEYFGSEEGKGKLYAVDAWTGETRWTFDRPASFGNEIAVLRNTIYVATHNGKVYALDTATGEEFWRFSSGSSGLTVADRTLYVSGGRVYALGALRGEEKWAFKSDGRSTGKPAVKDGTVYVVSRYGNVTAVNSETGAVKWDVDLVPESGNPWLNSPSVANNHVYVTNKVFHNTCSDKDDYCSDSYLYALDADTGEVEWKRTKPRADGFSTPAVSGNTAYFSGKYLHAVDTQTGTDRWTVRELRGTPLLTDDLGYIRAGGADGALYTVNLTTGEYDARFTPAPFNNSWDRWRVGMAVVNGSLYTGVGIDEPNNAYRSDHNIFYALGTPEFNYTNLSVRPTNPDVNETVNATVTVRNTGTGPGEFNATLLVNDNVTNTTTARLDPRTNTTVRFPLVFQTNGTYTVGVQNLTKTFTVGEVAAAQRQTPTTDGAGSASSPTEPSATTSTTAGSGSTSTESETATSGTAPGFGVGIWLVGIVLMVGLVGLRHRT